MRALVLVSEWPTFNQRKNYDNSSDELDTEWETIRRDSLKRLHFNESVLKMDLRRNV